MTRAIGYARVSLDKQARGMSLDLQGEKIRAYCKLHDLDLVGVEVDAGESASTMDRPALARAMTLLRRGAVSALVVVRVDRLTRSLRDLQDLVDFFRSPKRALHSVTEQVDTSSAIGRGMLNLMASIGQIEREQIGERTRSVMTHMREQGRYTGGEAPLGFAREGNRVVPEPAEQRVVARVRELRAAGLSVRAIAATLSENEITARGRALGPGAVQRILSRTAG